MKRGLVVTSSPGHDLTVVRVDEKTVTLSTGEVLIARYERLRNLAEQLCQERTPIVVRIAWTRDGHELVELLRERRGLGTPIAGSETDDAAF